MSRIRSSDISFPRNHEGTFEPLKTLCRSTIGAQPLSTLATLPLWPILGFGMASSIEFSQKTRNGAWLSAIIGLILETILFFYLLSIAGKQY